jgi:hypothetical protein
MADAREVIEVGPTPASTLIRRVVAVMAAFAIVTGALVANARDLAPAADARDLAPAADAARLTTSVRSPIPGPDRSGPEDLLILLK